jgi:hypothetical protein
MSIANHSETEINQNLRRMSRKPCVGGELLRWSSWLEVRCLIWFSCRKDHKNRALPRPVQELQASRLQQCMNQLFAFWNPRKRDRKQTNCSRFLPVVACRSWFCLAVLFPACELSVKRQNPELSHESRAVQPTPTPAATTKPTGPRATMQSCKEAALAAPHARWGYEATNIFHP